MLHAQIETLFRWLRMSTDFSFFDNAPLVHIGYPKCLSKWLQKNLFVPNMGFIKCLNPDLAHELIAAKKPFRLDTQEVQGKINFAQARATKMLPREQASRLVPVVTSEALVGNMFCGGFDAELLAQRLATCFPQAKILIVIREQRQMIRSLYSTAVAWGVPHTIEDFLTPRGENLSPQFNCEFLMYDSLVAHYQRIFSKDRVAVIPYELFKSDPSAFLKKIMQLYPSLGNSTKLAQLPISDTVNPGQTIVETGVQRILNSWLLQTPFNYGGWFQDRENWRLLRNTWRAPFDKTGYLVSGLEQRLSKKIEKLTQGRFLASNRQLSQLIDIDLGVFGYEV